MQGCYGRKYGTVGFRGTSSSTWTAEDSCRSATPTAPVPGEINLGPKVDPRLQEILVQKRVALAVEVECMRPRGWQLQEQLFIGLYLYLSVIM